MTERITRLDAENMEIVSTIDDPELLEYTCNENEKDVQHFSGK